MSMNLYCKQMDLWQTPTHITYMCYSNGDGGWKGIKYRYEQWVESRSNGMWRDDQAEEFNELMRQIKGHLEELNSFKKLDFSIT